jgi:hypothetical protein
MRDTMRKQFLTASPLLCLALLSACLPSSRPEWLGGEEKRPAADVVITGPRRPPVLNPQFQPPAANPAALTPPPAESPPPLPPQAAPDTRAMNDTPVIRKPFAVDPSYSTETVAVAPIPPAPELKVSPETQAAMAGMISPSAGTPASPSLLGHVADRVNGVPDSPDVEALKNKSYPTLSDVPEKPAQLADVKTAKVDRMTDLAVEHVMADEQRASVDTEPAAAAPEAKEAPPEAKKEEAKPAAKKPAKKSKPAPKKKTTDKTAKPAEKSSDTEDQAKSKAPADKYDAQLEQEHALY